MMGRTVQNARPIAWLPAALAFRSLDRGRKSIKVQRAERKNSTSRLPA